MEPIPPEDFPRAPVPASPPVSRPPIMVPGTVDANTLRTGWSPARFDETVTTWVEKRSPNGESSDSAMTRARAATRCTAGSGTRGTTAELWPRRRFRRRAGTVPVMGDLLQPSCWQEATPSAVWFRFEPLPHSGQERPACPDLLSKSQSKSKASSASTGRPLPPASRRELGKLDELFPSEEAEEATDARLGRLGGITEFPANGSRDLPGGATPVDLAPAEGPQIVEAEPLHRHEVDEPVEERPKSRRAGPRPDESHPAVSFFPVAGAVRGELEKVHIVRGGDRDRDAIPSSSKGARLGASSGAGARRRNRRGPGRPGGQARNGARRRS